MKRSNVVFPLLVGIDMRLIDCVGGSLVQPYGLRPLLDRGTDVPDTYF